MCICLSLSLYIYIYMYMDSRLRNLNPVTSTRSPRGLFHHQDFALPNAKGSTSAETLRHIYIYIYIHT